MSSKPAKGNRSARPAASRPAARSAALKPKAKAKPAPAKAKSAPRPAKGKGPSKDAKAGTPAVKPAPRPAAAKAAPAKLPSASSAHPAIKPPAKPLPAKPGSASKSAPKPGAPAVSQPGLTGLPLPRPLIGMPGRLAAAPPPRPPLVPAQPRPAQPPRPQPQPARPAPAAASVTAPFGHPDLIQPSASGKRPMVATSSSHAPALVRTAPAAAKAAPQKPMPSKQPHQVARSFYWSELREGDDLPPLSKPAIDRLQIARYAGAANDFNRLQLDEPFAHSLGFRGAFAPGALAMGFVGQLLTDWLRRGHVRRLSARFVKIIWPGDELTCHGRVSELRKEKGACYADLELWAENQKGELVLRGQATCELYETPGSAPSPLGAPFSGERAQPMLSRPPPRRK